jgi:hypothetical protein
LTADNFGYFDNIGVGTGVKNVSYTTIDRGILVGGDSSTPIQSAIEYRALSSEAYVEFSAANKSLYGYYSATSPLGTVNVTNAVGVYGYAASVGAVGWLEGTLANLIGTRCGAQHFDSGAGACTNAYALYIDGSAGATNNWAIYDGSNDDSCINQLRIGDTTAPAETLDVAGDARVAGQFRFGGDTELTISGGVVTATKSYHSIDTEGDGGTDNLDTISGGTDGAMLVIRAANSARDVVVKHGTGNIYLDLTDGDFTMNHVYDTMTLIYDNGGSVWLEISRRNNGA